MPRPDVPIPDRSRLLRAGAVLAAERLRPGTSRRRSVCGAARLLTGLGVRVAVRAPSTAWPRATRERGLLLVSNSASPLDPLVLMTAFPGAVLAAAGSDRVAGVPCPSVPATVDGVRAALAGGAKVVIRPEHRAAGGTTPGRFAPELFAAAVGTGAAVCPVVLRCARDGGAPPLASGDRSLRAALRWVGATRDVVVEVRPLPALTWDRATAEELATLAEYAIAAELETVPAVRVG